MEKSTLKKLAIALLIAGGIIGLIWFVSWVRFRSNFDSAWDKLIDGDYKKATEEFKEIKWNSGSESRSDAASFGRTFCEMYEQYYKLHQYEKAKNTVEYQLKPFMDDKELYDILNHKEKVFVAETVNAVYEDYNAHKAEIEEKRRKELQEIFDEMKEIDRKIEERKKKEAKEKKKETTTSTGTKKYSSGSKKKTYNEYSDEDFDPDDHDIDAYYEDYKEEFEDFDDAYDDFEDNPEYWDDY